jgi:glycosyltransferase involved in cell wall biosynthesis
MLLGLSQRPNLVIATHVNFSVAAYWLKSLAGVPYWAIAHGVDAWDIERSDLKRALRNADRIFAVSTYTRDRLLREQGLDPGKVSLLPDTVNADDFEIAPKPVHLVQRYGLSSAQPIILTISRLVASEQYKGYDKILEALPYIRQAIPNVHYIIGGRGNDRARIELMISQLGLQDSVTLTGYISDRELCDHYNLCDVFAMPSKREGFGIVYLEALACGKPVLAGNKDGATDALLEGALGALVDPDNINTISETLVRILRGQYSHPIIYQPDVLRQKVLETYGFERFSRTVSAGLDEFFRARPDSKSASHKG